MCIILDTTHVADRNIGRKNPVQFVYQLPGVNFTWKISMRDHTCSIHAAIGTTGTDKGYRLAHEFRQGILKNLLHGYGIGLHLPAMIGGSVV
jgi:hypothetical protein